MNSRTRHHLNDTAFCLVIAEAVASEFGITFTELISRRRNKILAAARHLYFWICKVKTQASYPCMAKAIDKDHTSAMYGAGKMASGDYQLYKQEVSNIFKKLEI